MQFNKATNMFHKLAWIDIINLQLRIFVFYWNTRAADRNVERSFWVR